MANYDCSACDTLREEAPNLIVNGMTDTECTNLQNDTGLSGDSDDCTDLNLLNDCLVGNMEEEVDAYDVCDWKEFIKRFIPNVWTTLKGIICAICGIWVYIHNMENQIIIMPKDILYADVSKTVTIHPGYDGDYNMVNINAARSDGYVPKGIVGWNLSNAGSSTGVHNIYPFKAKLLGTDVSLQLTNLTNENKQVEVSATVLYVKS